MKLGKEIIKAIIISVIIFLVMAVIQISSKSIDANNPYELAKSVGYLFINIFKNSFLLTLMYGVSLYFVNSFIFSGLNNFYKNNKLSLKRLIWGFLISFIASGFMIFVLRIIEEVIIENNTFNSFIKTEKTSYYIVTMVIVIIVSLIIHLFHFYKSYQESQLKEQKYIAKTANAKFESLKNQIDPHFLFNSLNVLSSLIEENPESAQKFTTSLSKIYRYVLEQKDKELVSVQEELDFAKTYMNLLKMRFENSISFSLPENYENNEAKVVPLSLQLLLENCIKHNIVSEQKPLNINIYIDNMFLTVENNLQKKETIQDRNGVGLQNIISRYALLTKRKVIIEETSNNFKVNLPILTKQNIQMETKSLYNENMAYLKAKERVKTLKEFYGNLIAYCIVIPILIFINLKTSNNFQWFWFPMLGWGLGLTFHAFETFGYGKKWEERKIKELMEKENQQNKKWN